MKAQKAYHGSLKIIFFELMRQYNTYNRGIAEIIKNGIRYEIPLIDFEAYREAVANAIIHEEVNYFLERLEERNLVESLEGSAFLSEAIRPKFADREQFILHMLKEKGFITRSYVAKSLNLSTSTVLRLLQQLVGKGLINRKGERGGSKYYSASK